LRRNNPVSIEKGPSLTAAVSFSSNHRQMMNVNRDEQTDKVEPGLYRHYKGGLYKVLGTARHSETLELLVVYEALYKNDLGQLWVRPLSMFLESVTPAGAGSEPIQRFSRVVSSETNT
jgi:hypothetical protein